MHPEGNMYKSDLTPRCRVPHPFPDDFGIRSYFEGRSGCSVLKGYHLQTTLVVHPALHLS